MTRLPRTSLSERLYAALLLAHPAAFRRAYGEEMRELFRDQVRQARANRGTIGVLYFWMRAAADLCAAAIAEHAAEFHARSYPPVNARRSTSTTSQLMSNALLQDVRFAARMLRKNPGFTLVALAVIALGTGAVSTIFSVANAIVLQPLPGVTQPSDVVTIDRTRGVGGESQSASYAYYQHLQAGSHTMSGIAAWAMLDMTISSGGGDAVASLGNLVSGNYFDVLGVRPALGRCFAGDESSVR
ncbi:MAG: ABC transporter permease, partial [Gemmatimonadaceae bacterium]